MKKRIAIICSLIIVLAIGSSFAVFKYMTSPVDKNQKETTIVEIKEGSSTGDIASLLASKDLIKNSTFFKVYSKIKGYDGKYQAGAYAVSKHMTLDEIARHIVDGKTANSVVTIPEGYTTKEIASLLEKEKVISQKDFYSAIENGNYDYFFLDKSLKGESRLDGFLFPSTYSFAPNTSGEKIINTMLEAFANVYTKDSACKAKKLGYSTEEVVTIASIIEREAQKEDERAKVASVVYNRLKKGMKLQMCSTIQCLLNKPQESLTEEELAIDSPYNTYINEGLPPRPICNPGEKSIKAALEPEKSDYLYFVVSNNLDGSMFFTSDYDAFLKEKEKYYEALKRKN